MNYSNPTLAIRVLTELHEEINKIHNLKLKSNVKNNRKNKRTSKAK